MAAAVLGLADAGTGTYVTFRDEDFAPSGDGVAIFIASADNSYFRWTSTANVVVDTINVLGTKVNSPSGSEPEVIASGVKLADSTDTSSPMGGREISSLHLLTVDGESHWPRRLGACVEPGN